MGVVSQGKAAEIAGVSRAEFITALARFGVSPFQYGGDELADELGRG
jgi:predicted HTH domain antitoxin